MEAKNIFIHAMQCEINPKNTVYFVGGETGTFEDQEVNPKIFNSYIDAKKYKESYLNRANEKYNTTEKLNSILK